MVWIGRGFPGFQWDLLPPVTAEEFRQAVSICTNRLRDDRVTLYSIDPAGMAAGPPVSHAEPDALENAGPLEIQDPFGGQADFDAMARATGGMALHGTNDVDHLIAQSVTYSGMFYTVTYRPAAAGSDPRSFRSIRVLAKNPRLSVTAPQGYFTAIPTAAPAIDAHGKVPTQVTNDLAAADEGLMIYDGVPLDIERVEGKTGDFRVSFPAGALAWVPDGNQEKSDITLLISSFDNKGRLLHRDGHIVGFTRQPLLANQVEGRIMHVVASTGTAPPATRVRVIVRANGNGKIGAGNYFLSAGD